MSRPDPMPPTPPPDAVRQLSTSPAWGALTPPQQAALSTLATGESSLASRARWSLTNLQSSPEFQAAAPAEQAKMVMTSLGTSPVLPPVVSFDAARVAKAAAPYTVSEPTLVAGHAFAGQKADADRYVVSIGGRDVPVFVPHDGKFDPPVQHTIEEAAKALAQIPPASLAVVTELNLSPGQNPEDAFWAKTYGQANFRSYMTCGSEGRIDVYPSDTDRDAKYMADTLVHETGHAWSNRAWGDDMETPAWEPWKEAARQDGLLPSTYAGSSPAEDVAETTALYLSMKGTPLADEYRKLYPHRFELLDRQFGGKS